MNAIDIQKRASLHLRLDPGLDDMLARVSEGRRKSRVEIAEIALRRYLESCDLVFQAELARQLASIPPLTLEYEEWIDANTDDLFRMLDEEDGGMTGVRTDLRGEAR